MASNNAHPFLDPLWRRIVLIGLCAAWFAWEAYNGDKFWMTMVGVVTLYGAWTYLFTYVPSDRPDPSDKS